MLRGFILLPYLCFGWLSWSGLDGDPTWLIALHVPALGLPFWLWWEDRANTALAEQVAAERREAEPERRLTAAERRQAARADQELGSFVILLVPALAYAMGALGAVLL